MFSIFEYTAFFIGVVITDGIQMNHSITSQDRKTLAISGVRDVISFDEESILLDTVQGKMTIKGEGMHILGFNTEFGDLSAEGKLYAIAYLSEEKNGGFLSRLFR